MMTFLHPLGVIFPAIPAHYFPATEIAEVPKFFELGLRLEADFPTCVSLFVSFKCRRYAKNRFAIFSSLQFF